MFSENKMYRITYEEIKENIANSPHILDSFFAKRTEKFAKLWSFKLLGVKCSGVHCHGLVKLKNDPNLEALNKIAMNRLFNRLIIVTTKTQ